MKAEIYELEGGVLRIRYGNGQEELFIPNFDLDAGIALSQKIFSVKAIDGRSVNDIYTYDNWNWFSTMASEIFWYIFYPFTQYEKILRKIHNLGIRPKFLNKKRFWSVYSLYMGPKVKLMEFPQYLTRPYNYIQFANNKLAINKNNDKEILFNTKITNNFRTEYIEQGLIDIGAKYLKALNISRRHLIESLSDGGKFYFIHFILKENMFRIRHDLSVFGTDPLIQNFARHALEYLEILMTKSIEEYHLHARLLSKSNVKKLLSIDETNHYVYPLIYACKKLGIETIGFQHGEYVDRHFSYIMPGLDNVKYDWFDKVIVWGEYWKRKLLKNPHIKAESVIIGCNKHPRFDYGPILRKGAVKKARPRTKGKGKLNVLVPYEFLANNYKVGQYLTRIMDDGHTIWFKPRSDEKLEDQLRVYFLGEEYCKRIQIVEKIDSKLMRQIDAVLGTQTTLLYELLPFGKPIFIIETEFRLKQDMLDEGLAEQLKLGEIQHLPMRIAGYKARKVDPNHFFNDRNIKHVLAASLGLR